jgi:adenosylcobinamide-GDP ribazoletransferase
MTISEEEDMLSSKHIKSLKGLATALRTLTICPWPGRGEDEFASSLNWFPFVGVSLGLMLFGIGRGMALFPCTSWPSMAALCLLVAETWLTRGLHLDGLADWADSIGGGRQREKRLSIMKDTAVGAFGILALVIALLVKWVALERLITSGTLIWVVAVLTLSRAMMAALLIRLPYARAEGGMGKPFAVQGRGASRTVLYFLTLAVCLLYGPLGGGLFLLGVIETGLFTARMRRVFGGITGDLLGTANEMIELTLLTLIALPGNQLAAYTGWAWIFTG